MEEGDSLLEEEEQRIADQLAEEELIVVDERHGEFMILLGELNNYVAVNTTSSMSAVIAYNICPQYCCKQMALCHLHLPEMFFCLSYMDDIAGLESIIE